MNGKELLSELRERIGNPNVNEVSNPQLERYLASALSWLASELDYVVRTETQMIQVTAEQQEYPLPGDFMSMIFVEWDGNRVLPTSTYSMDRDGTLWRGATGANLAQYAIQGRKLILQPPPSSGAVTADSLLTLRYIADSPGVQVSGTPDLSDTDQRLALWEAAYQYLIVHPSETNAARAHSCAVQVQRLLPNAKRRATLPIQDFSPSFRFRSPRQGVAR